METSEGNKAKISAASLLKNVFLWSCDLIVSGFIGGVKLLPRVDRKLAHWSTQLLCLMMRHKLISLAAFFLLPFVSFLFLQTDGILDPLSDLIDFISNLPFDLLLIGGLIALPIGIGAAMYKKGLSLAQAAKVVGLAVGARIFYLTLLLLIGLFLMQLTPWKGHRGGHEAIIIVPMSKGFD